MDSRIVELCLRFEDHLDAFSRTELFTGPSWYFHDKTLALRTTLGLRGALRDDAFFDWLYATLVSWGLHRMGPGNTKLRDIQEIRDSIRSQEDRLTGLVNEKLTTAALADVPELTDALWTVLTSLRISVAEAQIVANAKALHHLLPDLVPPIDRQYTYRFFYGRTMLSIPEREAFNEMFERFVRVATSQKDIVYSKVGQPWHTSVSKVVDNAIVGFMLEYQG